MWFVNLFLLILSRQSFYSRLNCGYVKKESKAAAAEREKRLTYLKQRKEERDYNMMMFGQERYGPIHLQIYHLVPDEVSSNI